jgi:Zn-dependent protease
MDYSTLATVVLWAVPVVFAITLHEAAHGYVARMFGDQTAWMLGRVTLNPLKHIDPVGTILVPGALLLMAKLAGGVPFIFGWAKPVPVNFGNLHHPKRDMIWVAAAGPGSNFVQALLWAIVLIAAARGGALASEGLSEMARIGVNVNLVLMALNILPIPPLDGGRILAGLLPGPASYTLSRIEPYGLFIILALLVTGFLDNLMRPLIQLAGSLIGALLGLG